MPRDATSDLTRDLLDGVIRRLVTHGFEGVEAVAPRRALAAEHHVSPQTVYNHLQSAPNALAAAAERLFDFDHSGVAETLDALMTAYRTAGDEDREVLFKRLLALNHQAQFSNRNMPAGWLLHSAAIAWSPAWAGDDKPDSDPRRADAALRVLEARRRFYEDMSSHFADLFSLACHSVGRHVRSSTTVDDVVLLMNALSDGLVLRATLDPDAITPELAAEAVYALALAFTEEGVLAVDPRRPIDPERAAVFDQAVDAAVARSATDVPTVADVAQMTGVDESVLSFLFDSDEALIESAVRRVLPVGDLMALAGSQFPLQKIEAVVGVLARKAAAHSALFTGGSHSAVLSEYRDAVAAALERGLESGDVVCGDPSTAAAGLVDAALDGARSTIEMLLQLMTPRESTAGRHTPA